MNADLMHRVYGLAYVARIVRSAAQNNTIRQSMRGLGQSPKTKGQFKQHTGLTTSAFRSERAEK